MKNILTDGCAVINSDILSTDLENRKNISKYSTYIYEHTEIVRCISMADSVSYTLIWMVKLCPGPNMCTVLLISKHTLKMTWIRIIAYICTRFNHNVQFCFYYVLIYIRQIAHKLWTLNRQYFWNDIQKYIGQKNKKNAWA